MFIRKLQLTNFKNHEKIFFQFTEQMVAFVGLNGIGKTNILDAIYLLLIGKSYFSSNDKQCIRDNESFFRLEMQVETEVLNELVVVLEMNKRKKIIVNDYQHVKNMNHVGMFPVVIVAPNDNMLVFGSSEERRKFIDQTLSQVDQSYLMTLIRYNNTLKNRNALLKAHEEKGLNNSLLAIYDEELCEYGQFIFEKRLRFVHEMQAFFQESFSFLSSNNEHFEIAYRSDLINDNFSDLLKLSLKKDIILKRTNKGIHKDDLLFKMDFKVLKDYGSQGQQKTFLLALKLTQFNFLKAQLNKVPLFIIDDIFDKLDSERSEKLVSFLVKQKGQVIISNTDRHVFQEMINVPLQLIELTK